MPETPIGFLIEKENRDIEIKIDFREGGGAARVFSIAADLISAFEELDHVLISSIDSRIQTTLVLEDVERSNLKVLLRNLLTAADDDAIKDMDWKKQVGKYLLKAKYVAIGWLDQKIDEENADPHFEDLTKKLQHLAEETDSLHLPDYPEIEPARLAQPLDAIQRAKSRLGDGEGLVITLDETEYAVDVRRTWMPSDYVLAEDADELTNTQDVNLIVRRPDLLGKSQWAFRHGKDSFNAPIRDEDWLKRFHARKEIVQPGDALRVSARFDYSYDDRGELAEKKVEILRVYGVIRSDGARPGDLFEDRSGIPPADKDFPTDFHPRDGGELGVKFFRAGWKP